MACFHPVPVFRAKSGPNSSKGTWPITHAKDYGYNFAEVRPCGKCSGCLQKRSIDIAVRNFAEFKHNDYSMFITLTYRPEDLPIPDLSIVSSFPEFSNLGDGTLVPKHLADFLKRFRAYLDYHYPADDIKIKFYAAGEYGDSFSRPHYHLLIYGFRFPDMRPFKSTRKGNKLYLSERLAELWPYGYSSIGEVNMSTIIYTTNYLLKQIAFDSDEYYKRGVVSPFFRGSKNLGKGFVVDNFASIAGNDGFAIETKNGTRIFSLPKNFDKLMQDYHPEQFIANRAKRLAHVVSKRKRSPEEFSAPRLLDREKFAMIKLKRGSRDLERGV